MDKIAAYIRDTVGDNPGIVKAEDTELKSFPLYILNAFKIWKAKFIGRKVYFLEKTNQEHLTPLQYKKQQDLLEKKLQTVVVFVIPEIKAYDRNRLVQQKVNFILADKQMFIPQFFIDLREHNIKRNNRQYLQPAAQVVLLYHLQRENLNGLTLKQMADQTSYSYLTMSRAVENLVNCNLCNTEGAKEKTIFFNTEKRQLWENALDFLRTPIKKKVFINQPLPDKITFKTDMNALAFYTNLNDDGFNHIAIGQRDFTHLKKKGKTGEMSDYDGDYIIEIWRYDPGTLSENNYVDPLSLYLTFMDSNDERIEMELEKLINDFVWS